MNHFGFLIIGLLNLLGFSERTPAARLGATPNALHRYSFEHPQMGTVFRLVFFSEKDSVKASEIAHRVFARIDTLNVIFSDCLPESELNRLCQSAGSGKNIAVSPELFDIIKLSKKFSQQSEGAFDITVGPLTRLWRRARSLKELPTTERITEAKANIGWQNIKIFQKGRLVRLTRGNMSLDLGGIAQGWTADHCLAILRQQGVVCALVDAGGDIALGMPPPGQAGWQIEIPAADGSTKTLLLQNCGITTSGATFRYLELDGRRYSHIIDPRTGMALTHHTLVTVKAQNATTADAWATAISVSGNSGRKKAVKMDKKIEIWLTETSF